MTKLYGLFTIVACLMTFTTGANSNESEVIFKDYSEQLNESLEQSVLIDLSDTYTFLAEKFPAKLLERRDKKIHFGLLEKIFMLTPRVPMRDVEPLLKLNLLLSIRYTEDKEYEHALNVLSSSITLLENNQFQNDILRLKLHSLMVGIYTSMNMLDEASKQCELLKSISYGDNSEPLRLSAVLPIYPQKYHDKGLSANIKYIYSVDECGRVIDLSIESPNTARSKFKKNSLKALSKFIFAPAVENGRPVLTSKKDIRFVFNYNSTNSVGFTDSEYFHSLRENNFITTKGDPIER